MKSKELPIEEINEVLWKCGNIARGIENSRSMGHICLLAYAAYLVKSSKSDLHPKEAVSRIGNKLVVEVLSDLLADTSISDVVTEMSRSLSMDELMTVILTNQIPMSVFEGQHETPDTICRLALQVLGIKKSDRVADFCCGRGNFLVEAMKENDAKEYVGVELDKMTAALASARMSLMDESYAIENRDAFQCLEEERFDKAFSDCPMGMKTSQLSSSGDYSEKVRKGHFEYGRPYYAEWVFSRLMLDSINDSGKAVCIITNGSASAKMDEETRKFFVENGMIEAVIALPSNLYAPFTGVSVLMLVLSHGNNKIRMVDATDLYSSGRRKNTMAADQMDAVVTRLDNDDEKSRLVENLEIADNDYNLSPLRYFEHEIRIENPTPFGDVIKEITRGTSLRASELDELTVREETGIKYLKLSDISDGRISTSMSNLKLLDSKLEKYCLQNGDLLISKSGKPFKIAVVAMDGQEKIIASGNLYVVRVDTSKVDPYYLLAYLRSKSGRDYLKRASVGTTIPSISLKNLNALPIPLIEMRRQGVIAGLYQAKLDEIEILKIRIEKARQETDSLFDEEVYYDIVDL